MIIYDKLLQKFKEKGITSYTMRKEKLISQSTWKYIQEGKDIDMKTINTLCKYFNCQPGDLLEYKEE